jgi:hypothetical protein
MWLLVIMSVHLAVFMRVPLTRVRLAMRARIFVENQRLDSDGHCPRRHANASKVNKIEAPQRDAIDYQNFALYA